MPKSLKKKQKEIKKSPKAELTKLTKSQEVFCLLYMGEFLGNGTTAYSVAYNISIRSKADYNKCSSAASRLLTNVKVIEYLSELKKLIQVSEEEVVNQLDFLIRQDNDFRAKLGAIRLRRDIEGRTSNVNLTQNNIFIEKGQDPKKVAEDFYKYLMEKTKEEK